jgi:mycothiol synthase
VLTRGAAADSRLGGLNWRGLTATDLAALTALYTRALASDGGQPFAADEWLLRGWYVKGVEDSLAAFEGDRLVGACAWRYASKGGVRHAAIAGQVAPEWRRRGIGGRLLDFALECADPGAPVAVETESLAAGADALYRSRGLTCVFAEEVMTISLACGTPAPPAVAFPSDMEFTEWSDQAISRFFAVYDASFRTRPGFPNWSADEWVRWISDNEEFRPDWTLLATVDGADVGFIAGRGGGCIGQVGVVPGARGQAIGTALIVEVLRRMTAHGEPSAVLNVNVNNPGAIELYRRLGFSRAGRRARYEHARLAAPWKPR